MSSDVPSPKTPTDTDTSRADDGEADTDSGDPLGTGRDLSAIPAGRRESENIDLLVIEAELVDEGKDLDNPARPRSPGVVDDLMAQLEPKGLRPAYKVLDDE
jgi:hypothetical protein